MTATARIRTPASHRKDLWRTFFFTPMAEIHQYAININQPIVTTVRTCIIKPSLAPEYPFRVTQAAGAKFRRTPCVEAIGWLPQLLSLRLAQDTSRRERLAQ